MPQGRDGPRRRERIQCCRVLRESNAAQRHGADAGRGVDIAGLPGPLALKVVFLPGRHAAAHAKPVGDWLSCPVVETTPQRPPVRASSAKDVACWPPAIWVARL